MTEPATTEGVAVSSTAEASVTTVAEDANQVETTTATETELEKAAREVFGEPDKPAPKEAPKPEEAEAEAPPGPEAAKPPVDEKVAQRIAVAKKMEMRAAESRRQAVEAERALGAKRAEYAVIAEKFEKLKTGDPVEILKAIGENPLEFVKRVAKEPEVVDPVSAEIQALRRQLEERDRADAQRAQEYQARLHQHQLSQAQHDFVSFVDKGAEKYPNITNEFTQDEVMSHAAHIADTQSAAYLEKFGVPLDFNVIAEHLEAMATERANARATGWSKRSAAGQPKAVPVVQAVAPGSKAIPRTLTNSAASTAALTPAEWTQQKADEHSIRILEKMLRGG